MIGAGQAGLAASYHLTARGREHVVLERGRVGESWHSQRWDGFYLNTPNWSLQLPGFRYAGREPDAFAPLQEIIAYLDDYSRSFRAPVREGVEVTRVRRNGREFHVETNGLPLTADAVIVAAGAYQRPTPTPLSTALPSEILRFHTSEYRRPSQLADGAVLIVGSGQSGCQIADELLTAGKKVYLSVGRCPWLPRRYRGREVVHWLLETGLADETVDTLPFPTARLGCNAPVSGNDGGHDCNPRWLARRGAILLGRVEAVRGAKLGIGTGLRESLAAGDQFLAGFRRRVDELVSRSKLEVADPEPQDADVPLPEIAELDLRETGIGTVLWANGFRPDHTWIEDLDIDSTGWPVQRRGVTSIPGLYFVGLHWLYKRKSALLFGVGEDAEYVVAHLQGGNR